MLAIALLLVIDFALAGGAVKEKVAEKNQENLKNREIKEKKAGKQTREMEKEETANSMLALTDDTTNGTMSEGVSKRSHLAPRVKFIRRNVVAAKALESQGEFKEEEIEAGFLGKMVMEQAKGYKSMIAVDTPGNKSMIVDDTVGNKSMIVDDTVGDKSAIVDEAIERAENKTNENKEKEESQGEYKEEEIDANLWDKLEEEQANGNKSIIVDDTVERAENATREESMKLEEEVSLLTETEWAEAFRFLQMEQFPQRQGPSFIFKT